MEMTCGGSWIDRSARIIAALSGCASCSPGRWDSQPLPKLLTRSLGEWVRHAHVLVFGGESKWRMRDAHYGRPLRHGCSGCDASTLARRLKAARIAVVVRREPGRRKGKNAVLRHRWRGLVRLPSRTTEAGTGQGRRRFQIIGRHSGLGGRTRLRVHGKMRAGEVTTRGSRTITVRG